MKYLEILIFVLTSVCCTLQDDVSHPTTTLQDIVINNTSVIIDPTNSPSFVPPEPHPTLQPNTTTPTPHPNTTTPHPPIPTHKPNTTTTNPNITTSPTKPITTVTTPTTPITPPNVTTTPVPTSPPTTSTTPAPVTTIKPVDPTTSIPDHHRRFDGPSFVGGIVLALGLVAIGFVAFKFYKARTELNYHTL